MRYLQKGQSIVEFALVLPLFLLLVIGMCYLGMAMADYLAISNIARSSAREAAVIPSAEYYNNHYKKIRENYKDVELPVGIFDWKADSQDNFDIKYDNKSQNVQVTMKAELNPTGFFLGNIVNNVAGGSSLANIDITYTMYSEYKPSN